MTVDTAPIEQVVGVEAVPLERVFRRTATWRVAHWANALSIVVAAFTGFYIAHPFFTAAIPDLMAWMRAMHFYAAVVLDVAVILLAYLYFFSRAERGYEALPTSRSKLARMNEAFLNFVTLNYRKRFDSREADPLNAVLFLALHVFVVFQMFTGFQLYVQGLSGDISVIGGWWPWVLHATTDWTQTVFGGLAGVRTAHLVTAYLVLTWALCHIYYEIWRTVMWREGDIGIAFGGHKFARRRPAPGASVDGHGSAEGRS